MYDTSDYPQQGDMALPILRCIAKMGGSIIFSWHGDALEEQLADYYGLTESQRNRTADQCKAKGKRVWRNHLQYASNKMIASSLLDRPAHDHWRITPGGYQLLAAEMAADNGEDVRVGKTHAGKTIKIISDVDEASFPEGTPIYEMHRRLERDGRIVRLAKQQRIGLTGCLTCDVCGFDFFAKYGSIGEGFIEAHHNTPVSELRVGPPR